MAGLIPEDKKQAFLQQLQSQGGGSGSELSPQEQQAIVQQGADQAKADLEGAGAEAPVDPNAPVQPEQQPAAQETPAAPAVPATQPQEDPNAQLLAGLGFDNVQALADAFSQLSESYAQTKQETERLLNLQQAMGTEEELDESTPQGQMKKMLREMLGPLADEARNTARNRAIAEAWNLDAKKFPDFADLQGDINGYIQANPDLAIAPDGLKRAYHAVRSNRYKSDADLLKDPKFVEKMASNPDVKAAVLKAHMASIAANGEIPASVGGGGNVPLTGPGKKPTTVAEASNALRALFGVPRK